MLSKQLDNFLHNNKWVSATVSLILSLYIVTIRPKLPDFMMRIFENPIFRIAVMALIVYRGHGDPQLAIVIAVAFLFTMNLINEQKLLSGFEQFEYFNMNNEENMTDDEDGYNDEYEDDHDDHEDGEPFDENNVGEYDYDDEGFEEYNNYDDNVYENDNEIVPYE